MAQKNINAMYGKLQDKYIDPFTDFGFKRLFGEECNKDLLLDFLNELLHKEEGKIVSITYLKNDMLGISEEARKAVFDIHCENEKGEKFIVEIRLDNLPDKLREKVFEKIFKAAEIAKLTPEEYEAYVDSLNSYRDLENSIDTARAEGEAKGEAERTKLKAEKEQALAEKEAALAEKEAAEAKLKAEKEKALAEKAEKEQALAEKENEIAELKRRLSNNDK